MPTYQASVSDNPYITSTSQGASDLFATSTIQWPYSQGINQPAYANTYPPWRPVYNPAENITSNITTTPQPIVSHTPVQSYGIQQPQAPNPQAAGGSLGSLGFGLGLQIQDMQDYPSPHSNVSEQTTSSCLSVVPGTMISPRVPAISSPNPSVAPSVGGSSSSRKSTEPPRNAQGVFYCSHSDHANTPVFSRKCEWTYVSPLFISWKRVLLTHDHRKHMDKHNRPYVCDEPECDNIRGFTYSGGLLRHQREVHRQHGGPKARCMCPYKDCKRSTGIGFSRKENLNEHLRRCHQPAKLKETKEAKEEQSPATAVEGATPQPRKRRRADEDKDEQMTSEDSSDAEGLRKEVKKLRRELAEKDERLKRLEENMEKLVRAQKGQI